MLLDNRTVRVLEVEVTQDDVERALYCAEAQEPRTRTCALSQALSRQFGGEWATSSWFSTRVAPNGDFLESYLHDGRAIVAGFDAGLPETGVVRLRLDRNA